MITILCECGKRYRAKPEHAGKRMKCVACNKIMVIPNTTPNVGTADRSRSPSAPPVKRTHPAERPSQPPNTVSADRPPKKPIARRPVEEPDFYSKESFHDKPYSSRRSARPKRGRGPMLLLIGILLLAVLGGGGFALYHFWLSKPDESPTKQDFAKAPNGDRQDGGKFDQSPKTKGTTPAKENEPDPESKTKTPPNKVEPVPKTKTPLIRPKKGVIPTVGVSDVKLVRTHVTENSLTMTGYKSTITIPTLEFAVVLKNEGKEHCELGLSFFLWEVSAAKNQAIGRVIFPKEAKITDELEHLFDRYDLAAVHKASKDGIDFITVYGGGSVIFGSARVSEPIENGRFGVIEPGKSLTLKAVLLRQRSYINRHCFYVVTPSLHVVTANETKSWRLLLRYGPNAPYPLVNAEMLSLDPATLRSVVKDKSRNVVEQISALNWLAEQRNPADIAVFRDVLRRETGKSTSRKAALYGLGMARDLDSLDLLQNVVKSPRTQITERSIAMAALGQLGDGRGTPFVKKMMLHRAPLLREMAVWAYPRLQGVTDPTPLIDRLLDPNRTVQNNAAAALVLLGDNVAIRPIIQSVRSIYDKEQRDALKSWRDHDAVGAELRKVAVQMGPIAIREMALELLGEMKHQDNFEVFKTVLGDTNAKLQKHAIQALGKIGDPRAAALLKPFLRDKNTQTQAAAVLAMRNFADPTVIPDIRECLTSKDDAVQAAAIETLAAMKALKDVEPLLAALKGVGYSSKRAAIGALAQFKDRRIVPIFLDLLGQYSFLTELRKTLQKFPDRSYVLNELQKAINSDADLIEKRRQCILLYAQMKAPNARSIFEKLLSDKSENIRVLALDGLKELSDSKAMPAVKRAVNDPSDQVRGRALQILANSADVNNSAPFLEGLKHGGFSTIYNALQGLARFQDPNAIDILLEQSSTVNVNFQFRRYVGQIAKRDLVTPKLIKAVESQRKSTLRSSCARLLGEWRVVQARSTLAKAASDSDPLVRKESIRALGRIGNEKDRPIIVKALDDKKGEVVASALEALMDLPGPLDPQPFLTALANSKLDFNYTLKRAAVAGLAQIADKRVIKALIEQIGGSYRLEARQGLVRIAVSDPALFLMEVGAAARDHKSIFVRQECMRLIGDTGLVGGVKVLSDLLEGGNDDQKVNIAEALGRLKVKQANEILMKLAMSSPTRVRQAAVRAMGATEDPIYLDELAKLVDDSDAGVQSEAMNVLGKFEEFADTQRVLDVMKKADATKGSYFAALTLLGQMNDPKVIPALIEELRTGRGQYQAGNALKNLPDRKSVIGPLIEALRTHKDKTVRGACARLLGEIRANQAIEQLQAAAKDSELEVQTAAKNSLAMIIGQ